jgi:hypothetical protein
MAEPFSYSLPKEDDPASASPTWGDYGASIAQSGYQLGGALDAGARYLRELAGDTEGAEVHRAAERVSSLNVDESRAAMTPAGRSRLETEILSGKFLEHPFSTIGLKAANMTAPIAASLLPLGVVSGVVGGTLAASVAGGTITAGQMIDEYYAKTDAMSDEELSEQSSVYRGLRSMLGEAEARKQFNLDNLGAKPALMLLFGAATNAFGVAGQAARVMGGGAAAMSGAGRGLAGRVGTAALEGGASEFLEEGASNLGVQTSLVQGELQDRVDPWKALSAGVEGAVLGSLLGAPLGVPGGKGKRAVATSKNASVTAGDVPKERGTGNASRPIESVEVGDKQNEITRSETEYPKAEAAKRKSKKLSDYPTAQDILEPEHKVALEGEVGSLTPKAEEVIAHVQKFVQAKRDEAAQGAALQPQKVVGGIRRDLTPDAQVTPEVTDLAQPQQVVAPQELVPAPTQVAQDPIQATSGLPTGSVSAPIGQTQAGVAPAPVQPGPRVLEDLSAQNVEARAIYSDEDKVLAKQTNQEVAVAEKREAGPGKKHRSKKEQEADDAREKGSADLVTKYAPVAGETDEATLARARAMVADAKTQGVKIKSRVVKGQSGPTLILSEANSLVEGTIKKLGKKAMAERLSRFRGREAGVHKGEVEEVLAERHAEGEDANRRDQGGVEGRSGGSIALDSAVDKTENAVATKVAKSDKLGVRGVEAPVEEAVVKTKAGKEEKIERAQAASEVRKVTVSDELKKKYAAQIASKQEAKPKLAALMQKVEAKKSPKVEVKQKLYGHMTPAERQASDKQYHEENFQAVREQEPHVTREEYDARVAAGMSMFRAMISDDASGSMTEAAKKAAKVTSKSNKPDPNPTEAQKEAGNYAKGHVKIGGLDISIENRKGSERSGTTKDGKKWSVKMPAHYGYIKRTEGADGDQVDVYVRPLTSAADIAQNMPVFVIDQVDADTRAFDEHKVMIGFDNPSQALDTYDRGFSDGRGAERVGSIQAMSFEEFKGWLKNGDTTKPAETPSQTDARLPSQRDVASEPETEVAELLEGREQITTNMLGTKVTVPSLASTSLRKALEGGSLLNSTLPLRAHYDPIVRRLVELAGDVRVHVITPAAMKQIWETVGGKGSFAFYDYIAHRIVIREDLLHDSSRDLVILHEAIHAVTSRQLIFGHGENLIENLMWHVAKVNPEFKIQYGFNNTQEFLAEAFSNASFQAELMKVSLPPELARALGIRGPTARATTMWEGFIFAIRKMLGLTQSPASALEAAVRLTDRIMNMEIDPTEQRKLDVWATPAQTSRGLADGVIERATDTVKRALERPELQAQRGAPWLLAIRTLDQIAQAAENYFPSNPVRVVADTIERIRTGAVKRLDATAPMVAKLYELEKKYAGTPHWERFTNTAHNATTANLHPDVPLDHAKNKHLHFKGVEHLDQVWSRSQYKELHEAWKALPADLKEAWHEASAYYTNAQNEMSLGIIKNRILKALDIHDDALAKRIHEDKTTQADEDLLTKDTLKTIKAAKELAKIKGVYFPLMRRGEFVVKGTYKVTPPSGARVVEPNVFEFKGKTARQDAVNWARTQDARTDLDSVWVDPKTGSTHVTDVDGKEVKLTPQDAATGAAEQRFRATVYNRHVEFFDTKREALASAARLEASGDISVDGVEPRKYEPQGRDADITSGQMLSLMRTVQNRKGYRGMSAREQNEVQNALREASVRFMGSTRIQSRRLPRGHVAGASHDLTRNAYDYALSASAYLSRLEHAPVLEKALKEMHEGVQGDASKDGTLGRRTIANEIDSRVDQPVFDEAKGWHSWTKRLMTGSFLDKLFSPAYSMINASQPIMVTAPVLAGRHGVANSFTALRKAYNDIGGLGVALKGAKETIKRFKPGAEITSPAGFLEDIIARSARTDGERKMFQHLSEVGSISPDSGLELDTLIKAHKGLGGVIDTGLGYFESIARQMPRAIESINRTATALAAYRLEFSKTGDQEKSTRYAQETVNNTQFLYSPTNRPKVFNHPLWRLALQFKQYGQGMYHLLGMNIGRAISPMDSTQRKEALKSLAGIAATHVAMAGAMGLPLEPFKYLIMGLNAVGVLGLSWGEVEDQARRIGAGLLGKTGGEIALKGLPRGLGLDLSGRVGLDSLVSFGEPRSNKDTDVKSWLFDTIAGAPASLVSDWIKGSNQLMSGNFGKAAELMTPAKVLADSIRAYRQATEGKKSEKSQRETMSPYTLREAVTRGMGFTPAREAENSAQRGSFYKKQALLKDNRQALITSWVTAKPADKRDAYAAIQKWNKGKVAAEQIKMAELSSAAKRRTTEEKSGSGLGIRTTKRDKHLLEGSPYNAGL